MEAGRRKGGRPRKGGDGGAAKCSLDCFSCAYPDCKASGFEILRMEARRRKESRLRAERGKREAAHGRPRRISGRKGDA